MQIYFDFILDYMYFDNGMVSISIHSDTSICYLRHNYYLYLFCNKPEARQCCILFQSDIKKTFSNNTKNISLFL